MNTLWKIMKNLKIKLKKYLKDKSDFLLYIIAKVFFLFFKNFVSYKNTVKIAGIFGKLLGKLPIERKDYILNNIKDCFPDLDEKAVKKIYEKSCENFVRNIFDFTKFDYIRKNFVKYITIKDEFGFLDEKKFLIFTAHFGNWELIGMPFLNYNNLYGIYKPPKNKYMNAFFKKIRMQDSGNKYKMLEGNAKNLFYINSVFTKYFNAKFAMLMDQKIKEGENLLFFNKKAKTSTFLAKMAIKHNIPLVPMRVIRNLNNYTFIIEISKELDKKDENGNKLNYLELTQKMNDVIEKWVKDDPYQWFFLHKRWG